MTTTVKHKPKITYIVSISNTEINIQYKDRARAVENAIRLSRDCDVVAVLTKVEQNPKNKGGVVFYQSKTYYINGRRVDKKLRMKGDVDIKKDEAWKNFDASRT